MIISAQPATTHALVVGIETYGTIPETLDGPAPDACAFVQWLLSRGVPAENVHLHLAPKPRDEPVPLPPGVRAQDATDESVRGTLRALHEVEASFLFVYWSGHAFELDGRLRMLVSDSDPIEIRNLDLDSLLYALRTNRFGRIENQAIFVDTCRLPVPDGQRRLFRAGDVTAGASLRPYSQLVLLSAQRNQAAANKRKTGVFSELLLVELDATPQAPWPPDLEAVAQQLHPTTAQGDPQLPALWRFRGWEDARDEVEILSQGDRPKPRPATALTPERQCQLLELIAASPETGTLEGRERVLGRLQRGPDVHTLAPDLARSDAALVRLVELCGNWPDGIMDLVGAVRAGDPDAPWAAALELAVPVGSLRYAQLDALWPLAARVDLWGDHLEQLYRNSLPHDVAAHPAARTTAAVVFVLADMTRQQGRFPFPVLEFVERVAAYSGESALAAELRAWVDRVGTELELASAVVDEMRRRVNQLAAPRSSDAHLQLSLRRSAYAPDTLLVRAWYRSDAMAALSVLEVEVSSTGSAEERLSALLTEMARDPRYGSDTLGLEFFVERDLLCHRVDEWLVAPAGRTRLPTGTRYNCVLRSLERAELPEYLHNWSAKWVELLKLLDRVAGETLTLLGAQQGADLGAVYLQLIRDGVVGVCLSFAPPDPADADETVLDAVIDAGLPIAIWLKEPAGDEGALEAELRAFLDDHLVADLRGAVREHRSFARQGAAAGALGSRVALLWDDPTRPLPTARLRQPTA
jgi:vWA-MoxR associated protein C-terminal domain/Caspase domain/Effector-associated domain 2